MRVGWSLLSLLLALVALPALVLPPAWVSPLLATVLHPAGAIVMPADGILLVNQTPVRDGDRALRAAIRLFQKQTGVALGVVLEEQLPNNVTIDAFANEIEQSSGLGRAQGGKSLLLVWSAQDKVFRVAVSPELDSVLPRATCVALEDDARAFMLSDVPSARREFLPRMVGASAVMYRDLQRTGRAQDIALPLAPDGFRLTRALAAVNGASYAAATEDVQEEIVASTAPVPANAQPDRSAEVVVRRYIASLENGVAGPQLPLLTEGSRVARLERPHTAAYQRRVGVAYRSAGAFRIVEHGPLAAATFRPGQPVLPILLRRNDTGQWTVDEAGMAAQFHLYDLGINPVPKYERSPYAFAWRETEHRKIVHSLYGERSATPATVPAAESLHQRLARAERALEQDPRNPDAFFRLAEILHFEMGWLDAAARLYERGLYIAPPHADMRWRLVDIYAETLDVDGEERQYRALERLTPRDPLVREFVEVFETRYRR